MDRDEDAVTGWLDTHCPHWREDPPCPRPEDAAQHPAGLEQLAEWAMGRWLDTYRPDYPAVIEGALAQIKAELAAQATDILTRARV